MCGHVWGNKVEWALFPLGSVDKDILLWEEEEV